MKRISFQNKQAISGGGVMAAWIAIMGVAMIGNLIASTVTSITDKVTATNTQQKSYSSTSSKKGTYIRMSPFPARSVVSMWM